MNNYTKLLANLVNVNVVIEEEDKTLILLTFFLDEDYENFVLTLIDSKQSLGYNEVESTPRGGVNRCMANLMTNDAELKTNCNTLSVSKVCSRIPGEGLWTISSKFL